MVRVSASILLLAFAALFIEAVNLPKYCYKAPDKKCEVKSKCTSHCCKMMAEKMKKHTPKKSKCNTENCDFCPLCAITIVKGAIAYAILKAANQIEYSVMTNSSLSDYCPQQWKPPNYNLV